MLVIARSELIQLFRNRLVLVTSFLSPVAACVFFVSRHELFAELGSAGYVAAMVLFTVGAFGVHASTVTTLASRRQTLFLKRLRSTPASDSAVLTGLVLPVVALALVQVAVMLAVFAGVAGGPAHPALLGVAVVAVVAMMLAFGAAVAGLTTSPEHAQVTALPVSLGTVAVTNWVGLTGTAESTAWQRLVPGGSATELVLAAWNGGTPASESLLLLAPTLGWVLAAVALASRLFRWEPRR
ncbi:ABC transporter permease [Streptomyces lonarensis]|uniref:ABC transporter permease n=1 Tax=Streptomyces lonarensis TaxID=700599 RepID=A0A7X6HY10_9ACTN|nr:ABC transporter permease [Streptomyces lonarensis]NJQ05098.1 ABC transporter permease [Streptomyces lonarensis]